MPSLCVFTEMLWSVCCYCCTLHPNKTWRSGVTWACCFLLLHWVGLQHIPCVPHTRYAPITAVLHYFHMLESRTWDWHGSASGSLSPPCLSPTTSVAILFPGSLNLSSCEVSVPCSGKGFVAVMACPITEMLCVLRSPPGNRKPCHKAVPFLTICFGHITGSLLVSVCAWGWFSHSNVLSQLKITGSGKVRGSSGCRICT